MRTTALQAILATAGIAAIAAATSAGEPELTESRTIRLTQTVTLNGVPEGAERVQLWVPVPSDGPWQRVLDRTVDLAPGTWNLVRQNEGRGEFICVDLHDPAPGSHSVIVSCTVERQGVSFALDELPVSVAGIQPELFEEYLDRDAPLMGVVLETRMLANRICGTEQDPARQVSLLMAAVADLADHYSKDPSRPHCGRGSAEDCLEAGGGCCTDLHSLYISLARARGIPTRIQFGYRALDANEARTVDPGYRCWVESFVPGCGWIPTDIVAADGVSADHPYRWGSLSDTKVWLWEGRSFDLAPRAAAGPVHTMICGWAEVDGAPVDPLPGADGTPSQLQRTIHFEVLEADRPADGQRLPH